MTAPLDVLVTHMNAIKRNLKRNSNFPGSSEFLPSHMPPSDVLYDLTNTTFGGLLVVLWDSFLQYIIHHNQGHLCYEYVIIERLSSVPLSLLRIQAGPSEIRLIDKNKGDSYTFKLEKALVYYLFSPPDLTPLSF